MSPRTSSNLPINMLDPTRTCSVLGVDQASLLDLINTGAIAAYDIGGHIRFRYRDVVSLASRRAIAA